MTKQTTTAAKRPAPKTPITTDAVKRVQRSTAVGNGGQQADWTRRLQRAVDKQR